MSEWNPTRAVLVDDTDPRIHYEGSGWSLDTSGATNSWGIYGPTYKNTLHRAHTDGSFSFTFEGNQVEVLGTLQTVNNLPRPSWICMIDQKGSGRVEPDPDQHTNHWSMCLADVTGSGPHTLTVNVTVPDGAYLWIDRISFSPNQPVTKNETVRIEDNDGSVMYSNNWNASEGITHVTDTNGSTATLKFTGTSVSAFGVFPPNLTDSQGTWAVDGGEPTQFVIPGHIDFNRAFNIPMFTTDNYTPGEHTLVITYTGGQGATPLSIDHFNIDLPPSDGSEASSASLNPSASETSTPSPTPTAPNSAKSSKAGAIAGGVVGGVLGLALLLVLALFLRRRRHRRQMEEEKALAPEPYVNQGFNKAPPKGTPDFVPTPTYDPYNSPAPSTSGGSSAIVKQQQALAAVSPTSGRQPIDVQHIDSGVRMTDTNGDDATQVRDIPPQYTEH